MFGVSLVEAESGLLQLTIQDDGQGIPAQAAAGPQPQRFGFAVMRGLAAQLGGSLEIPEGQGTTLRVEFARAA
jgi:nitrate/nitrite-specific signal transduction histidine kinase